MTNIDKMNRHPFVIDGIAGLSDAQYQRFEESRILNPTLEKFITSMHESIVEKSPSLLPIFRSLGIIT